MKWLAVALLLGVTVFADCLASDLPLAVQFEGDTYWLPCLMRPTELRGYNNRTLASADWLVAPPILYGPLETAAATLEDEPGPPPWAPSRKHPLGTDELGRDVAARLIHGARVSLGMTVLAVAIALLLGVLVGGAAALTGGWVDSVLCRLMDMVGTFPTLFFLLALFAVLKQPSVVTVAVVLGLTRWHEVGRLVRAQTLTLLRRDFIAAAWVMGRSRWSILRTHLVPNMIGVVAASAVSLIGATLVLESGVAFLGLGVSPPTPSWGELLLEAQRNMVPTAAWWLALFPGVALGGTLWLTHVVAIATRRKVDEGA